MNLYRRRLAISLFLLLPIQASAAIYKHTAEDGTVFYSDKPMTADGKTHEAEPLMNFKPPPPVTPKSYDNTFNSSDADGDSGGLAEDENKKISYQQIAITSPGDGDVVRANSGDVTIQVQLTPNLATDSNHLLVVTMDGTTKQESSSTSITFNNVDRGSHTFTAQVLDADGQSLLSSGAVEVHVQRHAVRKQPRAN